MMKRFKLVVIVAVILVIILFGNGKGNTESTIEQTASTIVVASLSEEKIQNVSIEVKQEDSNKITFPIKQLEMYDIIRIETKDSTNGYQTNIVTLKAKEGYLFSEKSSVDIQGAQFVHMNTAEQDKILVIRFKINEEITEEITEETTIEIIEEQKEQNPWIKVGEDWYYMQCCQLKNISYVCN